MAAGSGGQDGPLTRVYKTERFSAPPVLPAHTVGALRRSRLVLQPSYRPRAENPSLEFSAPASGRPPPDGGARRRTDFVARAIDKHFDRA